MVGLKPKRVWLSGRIRYDLSSSSLGSSRPRTLLVLDGDILEAWVIRRV